MSPTGDQATWPSAGSASWHCRLWLRLDPDDASLLIGEHGCCAPTRRDASAAAERFARGDSDVPIIAGGPGSLTTDSPMRHRDEQHLQTAPPTVERCGWCHAQLSVDRAPAVGEIGGWVPALEAD